MIGKTRTAAAIGRIAVVAGCVACAGPAHATVLVPADFAELVREAQVVVHGRIVDVTGVWAEGRRRVDTIVTLRAIEYFKGDFGPTVTFRVPGGALGRYRSIVVGAPAFEVGEEVVLMLGARGPAMPYVLGLNQGVFRVVTAPPAGSKQVVPPPLVPGANAGRLRRGDPGRRPVSLESFGAQVREAARPAAPALKGREGVPLAVPVRGGIQ